MRGFQQQFATNIDCTNNFFKTYLKMKKCHENNKFVIKMPLFKIASMFHQVAKGIQ